MRKSRLEEGKRQKVLAAEVSGVSVHCFSQWACKLACGNTVYRIREVWNRGKGGKRHPAPKFIYCTCRKCRAEKC